MLQYATQWFCLLQNLGREEGAFLYTPCEIEPQIDSAGCHSFPVHHIGVMVMFLYFTTDFAS